MEYFEEFAELIESDDELGYEDVYEAAASSLPEDMGDIVENYMEELQSSLPDEEQELYMLVENIKTGLLFLCENLEDESTLRSFADELWRFRSWYTNGELCILNGSKSSLLNILAELRANKITGEKSGYDITGALDYELRDFSMSIGYFQGTDFQDIDQNMDLDIDMNALKSEDETGSLLS